MFSLQKVQRGISVSHLKRQLRKIIYFIFSSSSTAKASEKGSTPHPYMYFLQKTTFLHAIYNESIRNVII